MNTVRLGDIADVIRGVTFDGGDASSVRRSDTIAVLRAGNIADELRLDRDLVWIPRSRVAPIQRLRRDDLVLCMSSGSPDVVGKSAKLREDFDGAVGAFCAVVRPRSSVDPGFLSLWFRSPSFWRWRDSQARGASIQNLRLSSLAGMMIPAPPLIDQRRIAIRLEKQLADAGEARTCNQMRSSVVQTLRAKAYDLAFSEIVPLTVQHLSGIPPSGWAWDQLANLARLESGHTPSRRRPDWWGGDIPWIALPDIRALDGRVALETAETTNPGGIENSSARVLPVGTVVMSRTASVGFVTRMGLPMATSQDFVNWVCGPDLDPEFLMHLLIRSRSYIRDLSSGAIHKTVYMPTVKAFRVCAPTIEEQRRIVARLSENLEAIDGASAALGAQLEGLELLPSSLLRRAFDALEAA